MKIQEYCLTEEYSLDISSGAYLGYYVPSQTPKLLPAGAFVKPISKRYVPKHVLDDVRWKRFNEEKQVFCYTSIGIVAIDKTKIREIG